jgi:hypothetical protein
MDSSVKALHNALCITWLLQNLEKSAKFWEVNQSHNSEIVQAFVLKLGI